MKLDKIVAMYIDRILPEKIVMKYRELGPFGFLRCICDRCWLRMLQSKFDLDPWHASAPASCRPYKTKVVEQLQLLSESNGVIEIGCGLGDVGQLLTKNKYGPVDRYHGVDLSENVIKAAQYLSKANSRMSFSVGSLERLRHIKEHNDFQILLLLQWTHNMEQQTLIKLITENIDDSIRFLVIDCIQQSVDSGYDYKHEPKKLLDGGLPFNDLRIVADIDEVRDLAIFSR